MKACYSGTFDPITLGHLDIIERASHIYDEVIVLIMHNERKHCIFSEEERKEIIERVLSSAGLSEKVSVIIGTGLTVNEAKENGASVILRGIRQVSDYEYELLQASANMYLNPNIETVLMIAKPELAFVSSSAVKEIAENDGDIRGLVPSCIYEEVIAKLQAERKA